MYKPRNTRLSTLVVILFIAATARGQEMDAGVWLSAEYQYQVTPVLRAVAAGELRFHDNAQRLRTILSEVGLEYSFHQNWRISGYYRLMGRQNPDRQYEARSRYYIDLRHRHSYQKLEWLNRIRWQQQFSHPLMIGFAEEAHTGVLRPEMTIRYRLNNTWRPFVSCELFFPVVFQYAQESNQIRFTAGTRYRINNIHAFNLFLMLQRSFDDASPAMALMTGIGYTFAPEW